MASGQTSAAVKSVFVADDTAFVRDRFKTALEAGGHATVTARSGQELLAHLRERPADLVVLDLRIAGGKGLGLVRSVQGLEPRPSIVVFSGTIASSSEVRELAELGIAGYVNEYAADHHILPALSPYLFPDAISRRTSPRYALGVPVSLRMGTKLARAVTLNVSRGGLAIRTTSPLDLGSNLKVRFRLPGTPQDVEAGATVAWVDRRIGMGVRFTAIGVDEQAIVTAFVTDHFFSNRKA
jgi:uncharacterized protein (TIGR02266 family)